MRQQENDSFGDGSCNFETAVIPLTNRSTEEFYQ
ncbi:MAG: hypothetical protein CM15mP108_3260 [Gammaproteobacteria bacterium]|nr:MAG: hypothetical protein CM15mP108_3260 [Gammaproteobacteria bacterium]